MADDMPRFPLTTAAGRVAADSPMGASVHWDRQQAVLGQLSMLHSMSVRQREGCLLIQTRPSCAFEEKKKKKKNEKQEEEDRDRRPERGTSYEL